MSEKQTSPAVSGRTASSCSPLEVIPPDGAMYGLINGLKCNCGGRLCIQEYEDVEDPDFRFEVFCYECGTCDPNGHPNIETIGRLASDFWQNAHGQATPSE